MRKARCRRGSEVLSIVPRLYAYPATLSRSVPARVTERESNVLHGERYTNVASRCAAPHRAAFPVRRPAQCPRRRTPPHSAALRRASRGRAHCRRGERCPSLSNYTCPLLAIASHLSFLSAPTYILPFPFSIPFSLSFFFLSFGLLPVSRSRLCSPRQVSSNAIMS